MQLPIWNHLTPEFLQKVKARGFLDVAELSPDVVTVHLEGSNTAIDWEHVILLKAYRSGNQRRGTTIVWNAYSGFRCLGLSPKTWIDRLEAHSPVTWQDMRAYTDLVEGKRPLNYVLKTLCLIPIGIQKQQYSWINAKYLQDVSPWPRTTKTEMSLVTLSTHAELRLFVSASQLKKKWRETDKIKRIQQINREYNDELYDSHYLSNVQIPAITAKFRVQLQERLLMYVNSRLKLNLSPEEITAIVEAARHNRDWPLEPRP